MAALRGGWTSGYQASIIGIRTFAKGGERVADGSAEVFAYVHDALCLKLGFLMTVPVVFSIKIAVTFALRSLSLQSGFSSSSTGGKWSPVHQRASVANCTAHVAIAQMVAVAHALGWSGQCRAIGVRLTAPTVIKWRWFALQA